VVAIVMKNETYVKAISIQKTREYYTQQFEDLAVEIQLIRAALKELMQ